MLCCVRDTTTNNIVRSTAALRLLCTGAAVPLATLAHKEAWIGMTERCKCRWSSILGANRRVPSAKSSMLQKNKRDAVCMYEHTSFDTYSGRHVLGLLFRAGGVALLCCAVLRCFSGSTTYILVHTETAEKNARGHTCSISPSLHAC